jgi:hypothetical protein
MLSIGIGYSSLRVALSIFKDPISIPARSNKLGFEQPIYFFFGEGGLNPHIELLESIPTASGYHFK